MRNENKALSLCGIKIYVKQEKKQKKKRLLILMSSLQTSYHFKLDLQKVDQHTAGKWLI